jgi:hypothetical protein
MIFKTSAARQTTRREMVLEKPRWTGVLEKQDFVVNFQAWRLTGSAAADSASPAMASMMAPANSEVPAVPPTSRVRYGEDNEPPEFPRNVERVFDPPKNRIIADFEVCPLETERPEAMQVACIGAAKSIFVEK